MTRRGAVIAALAIPCAVVAQELTGRLAGIDTEVNFTLTLPEHKPYALKVIWGKKEITLTSEEVMAALRPLPDNVEFACVETSPGKVTFDKCSKILKK
jgi:hypothetical protein